VATGPLSKLQSDPQLPLAAARDAAVSLDTTVESYDPDYGLAAFRLETECFIVPTGPVKIGERRRLRIAASDVSLTREQPLESTILNILPVHIFSATRINDQEILTVLSAKADGGGPRLLARVTRRSWDRLGLAEGAHVFAQIKGVALAPATSPSRPPPAGSR
jgi:molybdate transport system ATP-binding protein